MSDEHVDIVITADSVGPTRLGFGTGMMISYSVTWPEMQRAYSGLAEVLEDFDADSVEGVYATGYFGQNPKPGQLIIGRGDLPPTQVYSLSKLAAPAAGTRYQITAAGEGVTKTDIDLTLEADLTIDTAESGAGAVTIAVVAVAKTFTRASGSFVTDGFIVGQIVTVAGFANGGNNGLKTIATVTDLVLTMSVSTGLVDEAANPSANIYGPIVSTTTDKLKSSDHGLTTGDGPYRLTNSGGGLPAGSAVDTNYWMIVLDDDFIQLATSRALAIAETEIDLTTSGTGNHTVQRDANDVLMALLVQALNAVVGKNFTAAQVGVSGDADTVTITADAAGSWFSIEIKNRLLLTCGETNADPGIATDLAAIAEAGKDWRTFIPTFASEAILEASAAWVEAWGQTDMIASSSDSLIVSATSTGSADVADDLKTSGYKKTLGFYHPSPLKAMAPAFAGLWLTTTPGSATAKFQQPVGPGAVLPLTTTQKNNINAKNFNFIGADSSGISFTQEGISPAGAPYFFDVQRDDDYVANNMRIEVLTELVQVRKVPFTDEGIARIVSRVRTALEDAVDKGIYASFVVETPSVDDISQSDRTNRTVPDIKWSARRASAIHKAKPITGVVSV